MLRQDSFLLADDDDAVERELQRRLAVKAKQEQAQDDRGKRDDSDHDVKETSKWQATHQAIAEKSSLACS